MPTGPPDDTHAGRVETAVMLALRPSAVRPRPPHEWVTTPLPELMDELRASGVRAVSSTGVLGNPSGAHADEGHRIVNRWLKSLSETLSSLAPLPEDGTP
jgi:creatinine amidohydrolase